MKEMLCTAMGNDQMTVSISCGGVTISSTKTACYENLYHQNSIQIIHLHIFIYTLYIYLRIDPYCKRKDFLFFRLTICLIRKKQLKSQIIGGTRRMSSLLAD